ncbi:hypothetical protein DSM02_2658 [Leeuwenhoekiella polynyae]|uniref:Uncharacterized protein n=1 Tax=Leeuwenhoekiella polynyae TaxID=1550906 RepID=A0A4V1KQ54_9FLAO|nr:hypothetical protein DSM02_2658 [Leeuwenhoekiella polynyae]
MLFVNRLKGFFLNFTKNVLGFNIKIKKYSDFLWFYLKNPSVDD